jgi:hypothetical protein
MAGTNNQRRIAALRRLRQRIRAEDTTIDAWARSTGEVSSIDAEIGRLQASYQTELAALRAKRADAVLQSSQLLAAVASAVGDDDTARLLDIPVRQVQDARRSAGRPQQGQAYDRLTLVDTSQQDAGG